MESVPLELAVAERDRMLNVVTGYRRGELISAELPTDATYPGRIVELSGDIERQEVWQRSYESERAAVKSAGYEAVREFAKQHAPSAEVRDREHLIAIASDLRRWVRAATERQVDEQATGYPSLSQDDWMDAYARGGDRAVNQYYMNQKREHGFSSKKEAPVPEVESTVGLKEELSRRTLDSLQGSLDSDRALARIAEINAGLTINTPEETQHYRQLWAEVSAHAAAVEAEITSRGELPADVKELVTIMGKEAGRIERDWQSAKVQTADEATAATNHYRGQATAFNKLRDEVAQLHPEAKKAMPQRIDVEQIRVQQNLVIEQELLQSGPALSTV